MNHRASAEAAARPRKQLFDAGAPSGRHTAEIATGTTGQHDAEPAPKVASHARQGIQRR